MASRVELFDPTVPAGTAVAAPFTQALPHDPGIVDAIEFIVPPGPSGLVGFQVLHSGEPILPREGDRWIVTDNEKIHWELHDMPTGSAWSFRAYNLDTYDHTIYVRLLVREISGPIPVSVDIAPVEQADQAAPQLEDASPDSSELAGEIIDDGTG